MKKLAVAWNQFFFEPISPIPICIFRILFGLVVLSTTMIHLIPDMAIWFGPAGVVSSTSAEANCMGDTPRFDLLAMAPVQGRYSEVVWGLLIASVLLTIGLATRFSALVIFLVLTSLSHHNPVIEDFLSIMLRLTVFYIMWSNAGCAISVDSWLQRLKRDSNKSSRQVLLYSPWAQRLIQLQLSIFYLESVFTKLTGNSWIEGNAIYYSSRVEYFSNFQVVLPSIWMFHALSYATLGIEVILGTLIWVKPLRYWVMALGILFHLTLDLAMNIPLLQWLFIFSYITFVDAADLSCVENRAKLMLSKAGSWRSASNLP